MRRLIILSLPRSGTNWLDDVLSNSANVYALRELFNPLGAFGLDGFGRAGLEACRRTLGRDALEERDPDLVAWARDDPERMLSLMEETALDLGCEGLSFVVFPGHLSVSTLSALLSSPGAEALLLQRRQLDRFVSLRKALEVGRWMTTDTTGLRVKIEPEDAIQAADAAAAWFSTAERLSPSGRPPGRLYYERDLLAPAGTVLDAVRREAPWIVAPKDGAYRTTFFRQDRTKDVFDRIANGAELRRALEARGRLADLLGYPDGSS